MARYTADSKDRVRDAVDMADLVGARTELRRAGANRMTGLCPFHDERTPSFGINPADKVYYCFGCQASGDVFTFVMETEGVDFKGALELLADRYGVQLELEEEDPAAAERRRGRERLMELLERTAAFYVRHLWESDEAARAREYLRSRGLEEATLREFRVGYAPSRYDTVMNASRRAGFSNRELYDAGLARRPKSGGTLYDAFRSQITFPLADGRGRVLGFAGRTMDPGDQRPKYLNSREGELFHKSRLLFGADLARAAAAKAGSVIVAEGYTDVIALHQAGLRNTVAIMGTSLTEEQVGELVRLAPTVQLALDADSAGQAAMLRGARIAARRKLELRVVDLPAGEDPADLVQRAGAEEIAGRVERSIPFVRFRVERALATGDLSNAEGKDRVVDELRDAFAGVPASVLREELLRTAADRLDITQELLASLLAQGAPRDAGERGGTPASGGGGGTGAAGGNGDGAAERRRAAPAAALNRGERTERAFLAFCIAQPALGAPALAELELDADLTHPVARRAAAHLREHLGDPTQGLPEDDPELQGLVRELSVRAARLPATRAAFEIERLQLRKARLEREITAARTAGAGDVGALATRRAEVQAKLDRAMDAAMREGPPA